MSRPITRLLLVVLGLLFGLLPGIWAAFLPGSFYSDFPAVRPPWVAVDGPFNEHLIRDVGAMFLALGVIALVAAINGREGQARLAGLAWLVFSVLHFAYHVTHLHVYEAFDQWLNVVGQVASILIALTVVLIPPARAVRRDPAVTPRPAPGPGPS
jgi:hypothetical protein